MAILEKARSMEKETLRILVAANLGVGLGFLCIFGAERAKPLSTAIKLAHGAVKGARFVHRLHSPSPVELLFASTVVIKGFSLSKRLKLIETIPQIPPLFASRLKAFVGAMNLVRYARFNGLGGEILGFSVVGLGYKMSKNFLRVVEGFAGIQLDSTLKEGIEGLGLLVKAVTVSREFSRVAEMCASPFARRDFQRRFQLEEEDVVTCRFVSKLDTPFSCFLYSQRMHQGPPFDERGSSRRSLLHSHFSCGRDLGSVEDEESLLSELLCLSIPVPCTV